MQPEKKRKIDLKKFWSFSKRYVFSYAWWYLSGALFIAITQTFLVAIIESTKNAINTVNMATATSETIVPFVWKIILFAAGLMIARTLSRLLIFTPGRMIEYRIRNDYFSRLLFLKRDFFYRHESGDLVSRCSNDIGYVRTAYGFGFLQIANVVITLSFAISAMLYMDVRVTLFLALPMAVSIGITQFSIAYMFRHWKRANLQLGELSSLCLAAYKGVSVIQAYHAEPAFERKFRDLDDNYLSTYLLTAKIRSFVFPLIQLVGNLSVFTILWFVGLQAIKGKLTMGEVMAFLGYVAMVMPPLLSLGWMLNIIAQALPAIERLDEILLAAPLVLPTARTLPVSSCGVKLVAKALCYSYLQVDDKSETPFAIHDIHFNLEPGKALGIVGELGSGKSTLSETILRLNDLKPGQLWIDDRDAALCQLDEYRGHFAFAPQKAFLFSASLRDNLKIALPVKQWEQSGLDELLIEYLGNAGFEIDPEQFPEGLDTVVGEKGILLSGGQRQRMALARALLKNADIYILDDVLSAVDYKTEQTIIDNLRKFAHNKSFIIISHRVSAVKWTDEILVMKNGRISERGSHRQLISQAGYYRRIFEYQAQKTK